MSTTLYRLWIQPYCNYGYRLTEPNDQSGPNLVYLQTIQTKNYWTKAKCTVILLLATKKQLQIYV